VVRAGGGLLVDDAELTPDWLTGHLLPLFADRGKLGEMGKAAAAFGRRDGDEALADLVYEAVRDEGRGETPVPQDTTDATGAEQ